MQDVHTAEHIRSITEKDTILDDPREHVAFVGRSNVGKSSVINSLTNHKKLAAASSTPGKTRTIDFYLINDQFYFVDLPGFGYTKTSAREAEKLREMILWYLAVQQHRPSLVVHVVDAKAGITRKDKDMLDILEGEKYPTLVLINKIDKLNQSERAKRMQQVEEVLSDRELPEVYIEPYSTTKKERRSAALSVISQYLD